MSKGKQQQAVGVDYRLVIIASLVVGMMLIQLVLVESYSGLQHKAKKHKLSQPPRSLSKMNLSMYLDRPRYASLPTATVAELDMESLEKQLRELQAGGVEQESPGIVEEGEEGKTVSLIPPPLQQQQQQPSLLLHTNSHQSKSCKSRLHLFRAYHAPPAIVYFPSKDDSTLLWRQVMLDEFGFQETSNPSLATFLISRMLLSSQICPDSQIFNHLRGFKTALKTLVIWNKALVYSPSSTLSSSLANKKLHCLTFIQRLDWLLKNASSNGNTMVHAELVKSTIYTKQVSSMDLQHMVELYKKSPVCAMQNDETVRVQVYDHLPNRQYIATLPVYIASTKPWLVFAATNTISLRHHNGEELSLKEFQLEQQVSFTVMKQMLRDLKIQLGSAIQRLDGGNSKLQEQLGTMGRFGYFALEFLIVRQGDGLNVIMLRVVDHQTIELIREVVSSQLQLLKRTWFVKSIKVKPEDVEGLVSFELCVYELGDQLRIFPFS
ncbi:hypothetical protein BASA81_008449 [Batrachochytrium salamandrivorans]|nr:hypothetical protein BASA81_008449 [Batrachochytrium salamandrivorans]